MSIKLSKDDKMSIIIYRKRMYADEQFATIPNGKQSVLEEVKDQIEVCEEMHVPLSNLQIQQWLRCSNAIQVANKALAQKFAC